MGCEFLEEIAPTEIKTYKETFDEVFPYYLSIGMSYDQFWNDDVELVKYYRKTERLRNEKKNQELWLQGMYIYDAISTVIYNGFGRKKGQKASNYTSEPYPIFKEDIKERQENKIIEERAKAKVWLNNLVSSYK